MSIVIWCSSRFFVEREQLPGPALIGVGVAGAGHGARHRLGSNDVADPRHQQLGRRADESVDDEAQRCRVELAQSAVQQRRIERAVELRLDLTGQDDLGEIALGDSLRGFDDRSAPVVRRLDGPDRHRRGRRGPVELVDVLRPVRIRR